MPHFLRAPGMRQQCCILLWLAMAVSAHAVCIDLAGPVPAEVAIAAGEVLVVQLPATQPAILSLRAEGTDTTKIPDLDLSYAPRANGISTRFESQWISVGRIGHTETIRGKRFTLTATQRKGNTVALSFAHSLPHNSRATVELRREGKIVSSVSLLQGVAKTLRPRQTAPPPSPSPPATPPPPPPPRVVRALGAPLALIQKQASASHQLHHAKVTFMMPAERAGNSCPPETWRSTARAFAAVNEYYPQSPPLIGLSARYYEGVALLAASDTNAAKAAFMQVTLPASRHKAASRAERDAQIFVDAAASHLPSLGANGAATPDDEEDDE